MQGALIANLFFLSDGGHLSRPPREPAKETDSIDGGDAGDGVGDGVGVGKSANSIAGPLLKLKQALGKKIF